MMAILKSEWEARRRSGGLYTSPKRAFSRACGAISESLKLEQLPSTAALQALRLRVVAVWRTLQGFSDITKH